MKTKNIINIAAVFVVLFLTNLKSEAQKVVLGFSSPESVVSNGKRFFVSNIGPGNNKVGKDGDGFISEISSAGKMRISHFLPDTGKLNSPHGMAIIGTTLYVADIDRVVGYDINTRVKVFEVNMGESAGLLNDIASINRDLIVVSDTFKDIVYAINIRTRAITGIGNVPGPNGLVYDETKNLLYVCTVGHHSNGEGQMYVKSGFGADSPWETVAGGPKSGVFDGIEILNADHLLLSDWITYPSLKGRLVIYDKQQNKYQSLPMGTEPADMFIDRHTNLIYLPQTAKDRLIILKEKQLNRRKIALLK
ncbi:YncE family protein [Pedobacter lithocola]|uniref:YncE family protein n=1 Tax=Pedobacter lithocola TaxID=1908239 RepID=A0ABV8PEF8_9SPHI